MERGPVRFLGHHFSIRQLLRSTAFVMGAFPHLKLTYFDTPGRADPIRLAFYIGGIPFVDERLTREQINALKPSLPFGRLPVLEVDGVVVAETNTILRYAGRLSGLYPTNNTIAALQIDEILHALEETGEHFGAALYEPDPNRRDQLLQDLSKHVVPRYAGAIEERLSLLDKIPYFQGGKLFIHHLALHSWAEFVCCGALDPVPTTALDNYPIIKRVIAAVDAHPKVKEWRSYSHGVPKLKLTYFTSTGRAEPIRLALAIGGIAFEDERLTYAQYQERKPSLPFQQIPVLEVTTNGKSVTVAQSLAILRYVGTLSGLYSTTDLVQAAKIDELLAVIDEGHNCPLFNASYRERDPETQRAMRLELSAVDIPCMLGRLEKRVTKWGGPCAVGGTTLTIADVAIYALVAFFRDNVMTGVPTTIVDPYSGLLQIYENVGKIPEVIQWNDNHKSDQVTINGAKKRSFDEHAGP